MKELRVKKIFFYENDSHENLDNFPDISFDS